MVCGLTDCSLASNYGKIAILVFSSWGWVKRWRARRARFLRNYDEHHLHRFRSDAMFLSQVLGTTIGCLQTPLIFWFFYEAYRVGDPNGSYPAPYAQLFRGIAILGVEGLDSLPHNYLKLVIIFFISVVAINLMSELLKRYETCKYRVYRFVLSPMCMAIPFYLGGYLAIDMCIGSLLLFVWERTNKMSATQLGPAVASGLICGDSLWGITVVVLSLAGVTPPICMKFLSVAANNKVDAFLQGN
ncbi:hypothetical protein ACS0TY_010702 [Phlomoides rotata]